jgi:antitoxin component YwqK of YwqJK toxin-antitoxin module
VKEEATYKNGKLDGEYKAYYPNHKLKAVYSYREGVLTGVAKKYDLDGHLTTSILYKTNSIIRNLLKDPSKGYEKNEPVTF